MRDLVFVAGIHGVGKSTYCKKLSNQIGYTYFSCSDLIRKFTDIEIGNKITSNINSNQSILKGAIDLYLDKDLSYILDGHFCLLNNNYDIERIGFDTFKEINMTRIIILDTEIDIIYKNLKSRDNIIYDKKLLLDFKNEELLYCKQISRKLNLPMEIINPYE